MEVAKNIVIAVLATVLLIEEIPHFSGCDSITKMGVFIGLFLPTVVILEWFEEHINKFIWRRRQRHESD